MRYIVKAVLVVLVAPALPSTGLFIALGLI